MTPPSETAPSDRCRRLRGRPYREEGQMVRVLLIGLGWLSLSSSAGLLIGRAIHRADLRDEQVARRSRAASSLRITILPPPGSMPEAVRRRDVLPPPDEDGTPRFGLPRPRSADDDPPRTPPPE